jgi:hypothetical protein
MGMTQANPKPRRADPSRHHPGRAADGDLHRGQRLSGPEDRPDLCHIDPGGGDLDGGAAPDEGRTIQENNIVQTIASAAGTLSAIIFVLPGLLMIGWWVDFPYWQSVAVIGVGGILGVMYSVPLRRALVTGTICPIPKASQRPRC